MHFIDTNKIPLLEPEESLDLYDKIRVCRYGVQIEKKPLDKICESYLDDHRLTIPDNFVADDVYKVYGLHSRPFGATLEEVMKLIKPHTLTSKKVLVTTQYCDRDGTITSNVNDCHDSCSGMYMAVTTIWCKK